MSNNGLSKRLIFAFVFLAVTIPAFVLTAYAGVPGRIIGLVMLTLIGMVGLYEVLTTAKVNQYVAIMCSLLLVVYMLLPWNHFYEDLLQFNKDHNETFAKDMQWGLAELIKVAIGNWQNWLLLAVITIIPIVLDSDFREQPKIFERQIAVTLGTLITAIFVKSLWVITIFDFKLIFFFLPIAILSDTFGYFGGMMFGKTWFNGKKLAPNISPKKTWAGFVCGAFFSLIYSILMGYYLHVWQDFGGKTTEIVLSIVLGFVLTIITPLGDLLFSWFKRTSGKKDFSNLIPGHGGIYDRVDAMSITIVVSAIILLFGIL